MKKYLLYLVFCACFTPSFSQQEASNTLFDWNRTVFNPAFSGLSVTTDLSLITRQQWVGFTDAPKMQYLSAHASLPGEIGIGGVVYNNVAGPTRNSGFKVAFAKFIKLNRELKLSMALSLDLLQNVYDPTQLNTGLPNDPAIINAPVEQKLTPDASVGAVLYSGTWYAGLSCTNLMESKYDFLSTTTSFSNPVHRTFYLTGGYTFEFSEDLRYTPGALLRKTIGLPLQVDISNRLYYKNMMGGLSYRSSNDISLMLGISFATIYELAYAFDYSFNPMKSYSSGSHELLLRFKIRNWSRDDGRSGRRTQEQFRWY